MNSRTLQSTPESGERAGYDGGKRKKGSKVHIAVDTLGHLLGLVVTPALEQDGVVLLLLSQRAKLPAQVPNLLASINYQFTSFFWVLIASKASLIAISDTGVDALNARER